MQAKSYISDLFDYSHEFQSYYKKTHDLQEYREFGRSLTPKIGDNNDHLEQVRRPEVSLRIIVKCNVNRQGSEMEDHVQPKIGLVFITMRE